MNDNSPLSEINEEFRPDVIKEALKSQFSNPKTKITDEAVELLATLAKTLAVETAARSARQASNHSQKKVRLEQVETILPQMLDFP